MSLIKTLLLINVIVYYLGDTYNFIGFSFWEIFKRSGNVNLIYNHLSVNDIKNTHDICHCHFEDNQFLGRPGTKKTLIAGELPSKKPANYPIGDDLINKFKKEQEENSIKKNVLAKVQTVGKSFHHLIGSLSRIV